MYVFGYNDETNLTRILEDFEEAEISLDDVVEKIKNFLHDAYNEGEFEGESYGYDQAQQDEGWVFDLIKDGDLDDRVLMRAETLGYKAEPIGDYEEFKQARHRELHSTGPYGWEFCAKCS